MFHIYEGFHLVEAYQDIPGVASYINPLVHANRLVWH